MRERSRLTSARSSGASFREDHCVTSATEEKEVRSEAQHLFYIGEHRSFLKFSVLDREPHDGKKEGTEFRLERKWRELEVSSQASALSL